MPRGMLLFSMRKKKWMKERREMVRLMKNRPA